MDIKFLTVKQVLSIHIDQIKRYGGSLGIRQIELLLSALYAPESTFDKKYLYKNIYEMAAAYAYGIIKNHPFIDGNKRTGIAVALLFLRYNGYDFALTNDEIYNLGMEMANSSLSQNEVAQIFKKASKKRKI